MISDTDSKNISQTGFETYCGHYPAGTSFRCIEHFRQMIKAKKYQKYDFGEENVIKYNSFEPPEFNLTNIVDMPIALFCGL